MSKIELTEELVRKAYDIGCSDVKNTLSILFPKVFESEVEYGIGTKLSINRKIYIIAFSNNNNDGCSTEGLLVDINNGTYFGSLRLELKLGCYVTKKTLDKHIGVSYDILEK